MLAHVRRSRHVQILKFNSASIWRSAAYLGSVAMSKRKKSSVWTYFDDSDGTDATCVLCKDIVKTSGNTFNATKHLKSKHQEGYQLVPCTAGRKESKRLKLEQRQTSAEQSKQVSLETTLERSRVYPRESTRCKLDESLVRMLAVDLLRTAGDF